MTLNRVLFFLNIISFSFEHDNSKFIEQIRIKKNTLICFNQKNALTSFILLQLIFFTKFDEQVLVLKGLRHVLDLYKIYMRDTKVRSHCYVNKGQVLHLFTNFVNYGITISLTK